jgi:hypothetical protein
MGVRGHPFLKDLFGSFIAGQDMHTFRHMRMINFQAGAECLEPGVKSPRLGSTLLRLAHLSATFDEGVLSTANRS